MADLQDEFDTTAEAGELDRLPDAVPGAGAAEPEPGARLDDADGRARALLAAHPVADGYSGLPWALRGLPYCDLEPGDSCLETDVPRLRAGAVGAQFWSLHVPEDLAGDRAVSATLEQLDLVRHVVTRYGDDLRLARDASEAADARNHGRVATVVGPASARAIGDSLGALRSLHALGLSVLTLAGTSWAGGDGLSAFGEEVVREMNRLGVLADLSGAPEETARRVLSVSRAPVLFTRSGARALCEHPANLGDDLLAAVGAAKGLCLVPFATEQTGTSVRDVVSHLEHVRRIAGPECVGIAGTYDTTAAHPEELDDASRFPRLVTELLGQGWSDAEIGALTWGNVQRALRGADFTARAARERREASTATIGRLDG
ncbi:Membrane dipeptidase (Peptidase family M19) [Streptomyces sp. YIM 121038]|uniref:dipeptidase n=1 Tax=Streptomyces sp. YIM 121038 TaxID=2136401 RepID=UPI001110E270|nr:dipeptidase [Streptomyces sp. YIM 121038]QCX77036.1 Membrane dipeptidase (Peptidase family M19) [Streptomyces sp. YIM 121038]